MHRIVLNTFIIDAPSDVYDEITGFWAGALAAQVVQPPGMSDYRILDGASDDFRVVVQDVHGGSAGVHLDIHTDDLDAEVSDHLTVAEMAEHLGYSQASSFTQAFRRWKGIGPREYRQKALEQ